MGAGLGLVAFRHRSRTVRRCVPLFLAALALAAGAPRAAAGPREFKFGADVLHVEPLVLPGLVPGDEVDDQCQAWWWGEVGPQKVKVHVEVRMFSKEEYYLSDPEDVTDYLTWVMRLPDRGGDPTFKFDHVELLQGKFGWLPYASLVTGPVPNAQAPKGEILALNGVLEKYAYSVRVRTLPRLADPERATVLEFLRKGISATGAVEDPKWTAAEAEARWTKDAPSSKVAEKAKPVVRTKHYIIFTNSGAGALFAKKMEACYDQIQKIYPFPENASRRLMPVFLFKDRDEYNAFYAKVRSATLQEVSGSKGHAWKDYYATYYDSPNDPVHIHEATHQIFRNRLHLSDGGSWFQEGVAEYICTQPGERRAFARNAARNGKFIPFSDFIRMEGLLGGTDKVDGLGAYLQAASLIELLREDKRFAAKFQRFLHEMGVVGRDDPAGIERTFQEIYGLDLAALEKEWVKYWAK